MMELPNKEEVLRIVLIGLPYSGVEDAAKIFNEQYECKIFKIEGKDKPHDMTLKKYISKICFQEFKETPRAVLLTSTANYTEEALWELKKRNFVNVVLVDASFKIRLNNFLAEGNREESLESVR